MSSDDVTKRLKKIRSILDTRNIRTAAESWFYEHTTQLTQTTSPHTSAMETVLADHQRWNVFQKHKQGSEEIFRLLERRSNDIDPVNNQ